MFDHLLRLHLYSVQWQNGLVEDLRQRHSHRQKEEPDARHNNEFEIKTQKGRNRTVMA